LVPAILSEKLHGLQKLGSHFTTKREKERDGGKERAPDGRMYDPTEKH